MCLNIGDVFPDFSAKTTAGDIQFYDWLDKSWCMFFSVTNDFGRRCTAELIAVAELMPELKKRNVKPLCLACGDVQTHLEWINSICNSPRGRIEQFPYPIIADSDRRLSILLSILDLEQLDSDRIPLAGRAFFFIDPEAKLRLRIVYPASTRLNLLEIFRVMESIQQADRSKAEAEKEAKMNPIPTTLQGMSKEMDSTNHKSAALSKTLPNFNFLNKMPQL